MSLCRYAHGLRIVSRRECECATRECAKSKKKSHSAVNFERQKTDLIPQLRSRLKIKAATDATMIHVDETDPVGGAYCVKINKGKRVRN